MGMCLFGAGQGPSGKLFVGQGGAALLCPSAWGQACVLATSCFIPAGCRLVLVPLCFARGEVGSMHPLAVLVQESSPHSLPRRANGAGEE